MAKPRAWQQDRDVVFMKKGGQDHAVIRVERALGATDLVTRSAFARFLAQELEKKRRDVSTPPNSTPNRAPPFTPLEVETVLWYDTRAERHPKQDLPAYRQAVAKLSSLGLLTPSSQQEYITTDRGQAWVRMICATPMPRKVWVDEQGSEV